MAVPSRVSLLISILRLNPLLTYGIPPEVVYSKTSAAGLQYGDLRARRAQHLLHFAS